MMPTPQELAQPRPEAKGEDAPAPTPAADGERVVISGMSGIYPSSHHVKELSDILYNKVNPLNAENIRWKTSHPEAAQYMGTVPDLDRFDGQFFKVHYRLGNNMDPMSRKILEQAYNAIYDAGVNPEHLSGKKVGVFVGTCLSESEKVVFYSSASRSGLGIAGCCKAMFANRVSYWLNAKGPSMAIDESCCSSTAALEQAYLAMSRGECDAAIVGGCSLCLHPQSSVHYGRITSQAMDGKTKSFDQNANGCVRSEAINVLFLQKAKDAMRIYADLIHVKTEYTGLLTGETGPQYGCRRNPDKIAKFLTRFYEEARVPPHAVEYVEAFGSGTTDADKAELDAIERVFCKGKEDTLLVGSVISNIGYGEAASGISAITKVVLGYHCGEIAANLHCNNPRQDVVAIREGRMRVVTENQSFRRSYVAVNGMSVTGVNSHVLLHGHYKPKDLSRYNSSIAHLVTISARQDTSLQNIFDNLKSRPIDPEELALLHNIHQTSIPGHLGRGFIILKTDEEQKTVSLCEKAEYFDDARRPLWFVYSGMGSQWAGMGAQLMHIPIFAAAIERCQQTLKPKGIDIVHIITSPDKKIFDNILHSFVGIAAIQIGLTDVLRELGLVADGIIGHSVGELGCAYADGCLTSEEMILSAYCRGLVSLQTPFIRGSMAAIGLGYEQISKMCPPEIEVACHNGPESSTISGPADIMKEFVAELTAKGVFAKEVPCSNIAYHSRYIADAGPGLLKYLTEVIKTPKARSERWVSTSVPIDRWEEPLAKYSSAEYHTNNLLNPVLLEETLKHIPSNAVLVEVAPHGLLQAILKRSLPTDCRNIALTRRAHPDNTYLLLEAVGELYMEGYNPKVQILYPKIEMPVSTETPFLSHLVEWAHGEKWALPLYNSASWRKVAACTYTISLYDKEYAHLKGHVIREKTVFPFASSLVAVWDTLAMTLGVPTKKLSVEFHDVHLYAQPVMNTQSQLKLRVALQRGTGCFEVFDDKIKVATGVIYNIDKPRDQEDEFQLKKFQDMNLTAEDIYDLLRERDYLYSGEFRTIEAASASLNEASLVWRDNWVTFIDGLLQLSMLRQPHDGVTLPTYIRRISVDVEKHLKNKVTTEKDKSLYKAEVFEEHDFVRCGGLMIENIRYRNLLAINKRNMALQTLKFVSYFQVDQQVSTSLQIFLQMVAENVNKDSIKVIGITNNQMKGSVFEEMKNIGSSVYGVNISYEEFNLIDLNSTKNSGLSIKKADLAIVHNLSTDNNMCQLLHFALEQDSFIVSEEDELYGGRIRPTSLYRQLSAHSNGSSRLDLVRWRPSKVAMPTTAITVRAHLDFSLLTATRANLSPRHRLLIVAPYPAPSALKQLVQCWRKDVQRNNVHLLTVNNDEGNNFFLDNLPDIDLAFTVLDHGKWGGEYYVPVQDCAKVSSNVTLQSAQIGDLNSLEWVDAAETCESGVPVKVHYVGLSNTDIKKAIGKIKSKYDGENNYGIDFSGTTESGERVMGLVRGGAAGSVVRAQPELLWPVPAHWSLEDAATVPLAYAHALYCLGMKYGKKLKSDVCVLIHGGAGALGQALLSIVLAHGCEVYTTVSDVRKKRFLLKLFPDLKADHIGNSRDQSFLDMILNARKGKGCNVVISSAKGNLKKTILHCAGFSGTVYDVSQLHNQDEDFSYGLYNLSNERNYATVDFSTIFESPEEIKALQTMLSEGISRGYVRPLSRVSYAPHDVARAFRLLAASRHRGRVLLNMQEHLTQAKPRISFNPNYCQVLVLNEESFGLQMVDKLVARGARKLHIHTKAHTTTKFQFKLRNWQKVGVQIEISSQKLNNETDVVQLLRDATKLGPIQGIYVTTNDDQQMVQETLFTHLDVVSRRFCPDLRYFAVINVGKTMLGKATCLSRVQNKLPAKLITLPQLQNESSAGDAVDTVERTLCGADTLVVAQRIHRQQPSLLKQLAELASTVYDVSQLHNQDEDFSYGLYNLSNERNYATVDFSTIFESPEEIKALQTMLSEGISRGYVRPLSRVSYAPHDVARAFRLLAASRHRGRVLLNMQEHLTQAKPRISFNPNYCQVLVLNEESFGLQMVDKLVARGARKLHIHTKAHTTTKFQFKLRNWQKVGVQIEISSQKLNNETDVVQLLRDATKLGPIQGIYVTTNDDQQMVQETLFTHLDVVSRRFCPDLRYFAVINVGKTMLGKATCLSRVQNKLPAKLITLPQLQNESSAGDAVDTVERTLCGADTLVVAQRIHRQQPSLLKQLAELANINLTKNTAKTTTLEELGIQDDKLLLVASYLRINHNVELSEHEIPQLTVETILNLDKTENAFEDVKGLATFISYVDADELLATAEVVCMPTISSGDVLREDEFDGSQTYLCIVPGIEGHHEKFRVLCERLKLPALVLQPGLDRPTETERETAKRYVDVLLNKTGLKNTFYLLGYETGVLVALEMAAILEDLGLIGTVYCLGCDPSEVQTVIEENIAEYKTKEQLQNGVIKHMFKLMVGDDAVDMEGALKDGDSWPQKVDACVRTLLGHVPHSAQYSRALIEATLARIERARGYVTPARALRSQLVLLRAASAHVTSPVQVLQRHSQRPVAIHQLTAPLVHATNDMSCASVINEYLDQEILESFKEKNICEAYLLNLYTFMIAQ